MPVVAQAVPRTDSSHPTRCEPAASPALGTGHRLAPVGYAARQYATSTAAG